MKRLAVVLLCWIMGMPVAMAAGDKAAAVADFAKAVEAYRSGKYPDAVLLNERALGSGFESPAIYYNLGNSYLKSGQMGNAVLNYLRAEQLSPRDADIAANLSYARNIVAAQPFTARDWVFKFFHVGDFSRHEIKWLAFAAFVLFSSFLLAGYYLKLSRSRFMIISVLLCLGWLYWCAASVIKLLDDSGRAVMVHSTESRFEPSDRATVYFKIPEGFEVRIRKEQQDWVKIERFDGKTGWCPGKHVERIRE